MISSATRKDILCRFRTAAAAAVVAAGAMFGAQGAQAGVIQLGFIIDSSGSLGPVGWTTVKQGLVEAITTLVPRNGTYEVTVVKFDTTASTVVAPTVITAATISTVIVSILNAAGAGGYTNMADAFELMTTLLTGSPNFKHAEASYVNLATDGVPNYAPNQPGDPVADTIAERNLMISAGIDNISVEGITNFVDADFLQNSICYPGPCDTTAPYDFPNKGFYIGVDSLDDFGDAISEKILVVTGQVPEPASAAILGLSLMMLGAGALRRRKAA